jgi:hypothetical protein
MTASRWLDDVPALDGGDLRTFHRVANDVLHRLARDRPLLSRLVREIERDPHRLAASRVTLLVDRLLLYRANERGFEIRLDLNPRPANQELLHNHAYPFATRS